MAEDVKTGWQPFSTAPYDGSWFVALPRPELGFGGQPFPPSVCRIHGPYPNVDTGQRTDWSIECKAMNSGSSVFKLTDFTHWMALPERPE